MQYTNWNDLIRIDVEEILAPQTQGQIAAIIRDARQSGRHVKAIGSAHSFNDLGMCEDLLIDISRLDGFEVIDSEKRLVAAGGGITLTRLVEELEKVGLALANQGAWTAQTLAGVISTATHGSRGRYRETLIGSVRELHLIDGTGETQVLAGEGLRWLTLGFFGVITKVVLQCQPLRTLRRANERMNGKQAIDRIEAELAAHDFVDLRWVGHLEPILVRRWDIVPRNPSLRDRYRYRSESLKLGGLNGLLSVVRLSKIPGNLLERGLGWGYIYTGEGKPHNARWHAALTFNSLRLAAPHEEREFAIPQEEAKTCLHRLREVMLKDPSSASLEIQVRFSSAVDVRMAPNHGRDTCWFNLNMLAPSRTEDIVERLTEVAYAHGARPHWGKSISANTPPLAQLYGEDLLRWEEIRKRYDPHGLFLNDWYHRYIDLAPRTFSEAREKPHTPESLARLRRLRRPPRPSTSFSASQLARDCTKFANDSMKELLRTARGASAAPGTLEKKAHS